MCKSKRSRCSAYDLLIEIVTGSPENYKALYAKLMQQHEAGVCPGIYNYGVIAVSPRVASETQHSDCTGITGVTSFNEQSKPFTICSWGR